MPRRGSQMIEARFKNLKEYYITSGQNQPYDALDRRDIADMISQMENPLRFDLEEVKKSLGYSSYELAQSGDFSEFERVHPILRNYLAMQSAERNRNLLNQIETWRQDPDPIYQELARAELRNHMYNPVLRLGMSILRKQGEEYKYYQDLDDIMIDMIMEDTLNPMTERQIQNVTGIAGDSKKAQEMIDMNVEKQVQVAKMMLMAHMGNTRLIKDGQPEEMDRSVSSMMAHCSRAAFVLPPGEKGEVSRMMGQMTGPQKGKAAGIYGRFAATHSTSQGKSIDDFKEKKGVSLRHQYGMDVAIGGLGNDGIKGKKRQPQMLKNDGTCGHMYMRVDVGGKDKTSSLLIGFESDSPSAAGNQQGHTHTASAAPEYMSSFLGQRTDEMGDKYGGRIVDCTAYSPQELSDIVEDFAAQYRGMIREAMQHPEARKRLEQANAMLAGKLMDAPQMETFFNKAGFGIEKAREHAGKMAEKKGLEYRPDLNKHGDEAVPALQVVEKPDKRQKIKAFFGSTRAKQKIQDFQNYLKAKQEMDAVTAHKAMAALANEKSEAEWNREQQRLEEERRQEAMREEKRLMEELENAEARYAVWEEEERERTQSQKDAKRDSVSMNLEDLEKEEAGEKPKRKDFKQVREEWKRNKPVRDLQAANENLQRYQEAQKGPKQK